jgi:hypothetical protein
MPLQHHILLSGVQDRLSRGNLSLTLANYRLVLAIVYTKQRLTFLYFVADHDIDMGDHTALLNADRNHLAGRFNYS